jgi:hypothetical protein
MVLALDDLTKQEKPNLLGTSRKWEVDRTTLMLQITCYMKRPEDAMGTG